MDQINHRAAINDETDETGEDKLPANQVRPPPTDLGKKQVAGEAPDWEDLWLFIHGFGGDSNCRKSF